MQLLNYLHILNVHKILLVYVVENRVIAADFDQIVYERPDSDAMHGSLEYFVLVIYIFCLSINITAHTLIGIANASSLSMHFDTEIPQGATNALRLYFTKAH